MPALTEPEVIEVANATATREGIKLPDYKAPSVRYDAAEKNREWIVNYECAGNTPPPGCHFVVFISDETRKAELVGGE